MDGDLANFWNETQQRHLIRVDERRLALDPLPGVVGDVYASALVETLRCDQP
jgi:hypothetical protein